MKKIIGFCFCALFVFSGISFVSAQEIGDTIRVQVLDYNTRNRDTLAKFPETGEFEKIILRYNMRCKNALVSTSQNRNLGCGEWDYSCNTFVVDSAKIEARPNTHPDYIITAFDDNLYDEYFYTDAPTFDFYRYTSEVPNVVVNSEESFSIASGAENYANLVSDGSFSHKAVILYSAAEISAAGLQGNQSVDGIGLEVLSGATTVPFLKVRAAQINADEISGVELEDLEFVEVLDRSFEFEAGENKLYFHNPITWDGSSSIVFEISYTNRSGQAGITFAGAPSAESQSLYAANNFSADLQNGGRFTINSAELNSISDELSISFWTYGDSEVLPVNTSALYGFGTNPGQRDLNVHLPWSNGQVYFDCGWDGGYDRINAVVDAEDFEGRWNHWGFVKNAVTGVMAMYVNGELVTSGNGKDNPITLENLVIGSDQNGNNAYPGAVCQLAVWDRMLSIDELNLASRQRISTGHELNDGLVSYFAFDEGAGNTMDDEKFGTMADGTNIFWDLTRGEDIFRDFNQSDQKPALSIYSGSYTITIDNVFVLDSVQRSPNLIKQYEIGSNEGMLKDDEILLVDEFSQYEAYPEIYYDIETGYLYDIKEVDIVGSIEINQLDYSRRYPYYNEIMSFVTPYGIGLDMGQDGESWYFDVSDYAPLLKGDKRLLLTMGGQNQEDMDIEFLFIVGTPPRDVISYDQLWQGSNSRGSANINSILQETRYAPVTVEIPLDAEEVKMRSTITGHGAEGEFQQNGGAITHYLNVNGGANEYSWNAQQECSENPIFPQGGTWVYDRQGWCPGAPSFTKESSFTEFVQPGDAATFDYDISQPNNANGDYRYIVAHQLVSYGRPNHEFDAAISAIRMPSDNVVESRKNPICGNPVITIQNTGANMVTSLTIEYWIDDMTRSTYNWSGALEFMESEDVEIPADGMFQGLDGNHTFHAEIVTADDYSFNDHVTSVFQETENYPELFIFRVETNIAPQHNSYKIYDINGDVVISRSLPSANTTYQDTIVEPGCYRIEFLDTGGDGLSWWANPNQGSGNATVRHPLGFPMKTFEPDFGGEFTYSFSVGGPVSTSEEIFSDVDIFPNPAFETFTVRGEGVDNYSYRLLTSLGNEIHARSSASVNRIDFWVSELPSGLYYVELRDGNSSVLKKVVIE